MESATTPNAVVLETTIEAEPEIVFEFFTDPEKMKLWMGRSAELDPRPGGVMRCEVTPRGTAEGHFVELDPPNRLVFTWGWDSAEAETPAGSSTIEVKLKAIDAGTHLTFTHTGLEGDSIDGHRKGWDHYLGRLKTSAAGGDPGEDPWQETAPEM